jgi:cobalt-zinc-cadmium efflux system outer membrane protein
MQKLFYLIAGIGIVSVLGAQPADVEGALALALQRNPRVQALQQEIQSAQRLSQSASALSAPSILLAPAITTGGVGEELLLQQPLEITGIRQARMRVGQAEYELALAQAALELNDLLAEVAVVYYEYTYRQRIAQTAHEALQLAERTRDAIRQQVEAGVRAGVDLIQAEIELERVRQHALMRQTEAAAAQERLRVSVGGFDEPQPTATSTVDWKRGLLTEDETVPLSLRPQTARLRLEQALAQQIRAEGLPDLGVQLRIERFQGERTRPGFGLTLSLPLLDYGARQNRLRAQNNLIEAQRLRLQQTRLALEAELRNAEQRLNQAQTRAESYQKTILPRAQQLAQAAQVGLETGQLSILQLLEAQRTARIVQEEALEAELELKLSEVGLKRLRGEFIPKEVKL